MLADLEISGIEGALPVAACAQAWLAGLSPRENRDVPPLDYAQEHFPEKWASGFPQKMRPPKEIEGASRRTIDST